MSKVLDENGLPALWEAIINTCPRMAAGSYQGTGTYGQSNPSSLVFDFVPAVVIIHQGTEVCIMTPTMTPNYMGGKTGSGWTTRSSYNSGTAYSMTVTEWGTTVKWYSSTGSSADYQFNSSSWIYDYVAFG